MSALAWICIVVGALVIVTRAPLIVYPRQMLELYRKLWATNTRVRWIGALVGVLTLGLIPAAPGASDTAALVLILLGVTLVAVTIWLLGFPASYRRLADSVTQFVDESVDTALPRAAGVLGTAIGVALIYLGIRWL